MLKKIQLHFGGWRPMLPILNLKVKKRPSNLTTYSHLTSGIFFAHAVNTPLTTITLQLEEAVRRLNAEPHLKQEQQQLLQALASAYHLQKLMQFKSSKTNKLVFAIKETIEEVVHRLADPKSRIIASALLLNAQTKLAGPAFIFQEALSCLITNGFEAYHEGSKKRISLTAFETRRHCLIYICDSEGYGLDDPTVHFSKWLYY